jgi:hypothetical protein
MMRRSLALALGLVGCARASIGGLPAGDDNPGTPDSDNPSIDASEQVDARSIDAPPPIDAAFVQTLQQTQDNVIAGANSLACLNGFNETAEISWYRVFSLADHNITNRPF